MFLSILKDIIATIAGCILLYVIGADLLFWLRIKLPRIEHFIFALGVGMAAFTFISYGLVWMNLRLLAIIIPYVAVAYFLWKRRKILGQMTQGPVISKKIFVLFAVFSVCFLIPYFASGDFGSFISLIGVHYTDSPLHVTLINELKRQFPPMDPGMAGIRLSAYHFFYNFTASLLSSSLFVPSSTIHFRVLPVVFAVLWPFLVFFIARELFDDTLAGIYSIFFSMFGASFSWYITWKYHIPVSFNSGLGILQPSTSLVNPPYASSVVVLLLGVYSLIHFERSKKIGWLVPVVMCLGTVVEYKVYAGIIALAGFGIYTLFRILRDRAKIVIAGISCVAIAFAVYWPFTGSSGFLVWAPLWAPHEIARNALTFLRYDNAIYVYGQLFDPLRIVWLEIKVLTYFTIGNFGLRTLGLVLLGISLFRKSQKRILFCVFGGMFLVSFIIPLLFMQSLKPFEISQMFNYSLLILSFPTGYFFSSIGKKLPKIAMFVIVLFVMANSVPELIKDDYPQYITLPVRTITGAQYTLFKHIQASANGKGVTLEMPPAGESAKSLNLWFRYQTNLFLPAFTGTRSFLAFTNIIYSEEEVSKRLSILVSLRTMNDSLEQDQLNKDQADQITAETKRILSSYGVRYIYSPYPLTGFEKSGLVTPDPAVSYNYLYKVD